MNQFTTLQKINAKERLEAAALTKEVLYKLNNKETTQIFQHFDDKMFEQMIDSIKFITLKERGHKLFDIGDVPDNFYFVLRGALRLEAPKY